MLAKTKMASSGHLDQRQTRRGRNPLLPLNKRGRKQEFSADCSQVIFLGAAWRELLQKTIKQGSYNGWYEPCPKEALLIKVKDFLLVLGIVFIPLLAGGVVIDVLSKIFWP